jgi:hypothetical protein
MAALNKAFPAQVDRVGDKIIRKNYDPWFIVYLT